MIIIIQMKCKIDDISFSKLLFRDISVQNIANGATTMGWLNKQVYIYKINIYIYLIIIIM